MTGITPIYEGDEPCVTICDDGSVLVGTTVSSGVRHRTVEAYEDFREKEDLAYALARAEWVRTRFPSLLGVK